MKVLLIEPKYGFADALPWIPIGKAYMASVLRLNGFDVRIIDNALQNYTDEQLIGCIEEYTPDIICTGGMTLQFNDTKRIAALSKHLYGSKVFLVGGGVHLSIKPEDGLNYFDVIVIGEGEDTIVELCKQYEKEGKNLENYKDIKGIYFKTELGEVVRTEPRGFISNLDRLPLPAYDLLSVKRYHDFLITGQRAVSIMTGRGCPYNCEFCASPFLSQQKVRYFSLDYTFSLITYLIENYGFSNFRIMDDTFTLNKRRVLDFCDQIEKRGLKLNMTCLTHVNTYDFEMFRRMKEVGFSIIAFGIESGNDRILKLINKGISRGKAINAINAAKNAGLMVENLFMIGNIGETKETIKDSIRFAKDYNPPYKGWKRIGFNWFQFATPVPGSRFFYEAKDYGEVISFNYDDYSHQKPVFIPKGLNINTMIALRKKALRKANSPAYFFKKLKKLSGFLQKTKNILIGNTQNKRQNED